MAEPRLAPCIYVVAGVNGAGKSSIAGAMFRERGAAYFNPDEAASRIRRLRPGIGREEANGIAWNEGRRLLERAIADHLTFAFETTLGGRTIPGLLDAALTEGMEVRVWYVGLRSPELHVERVRARVARGGHDIPEAAIRERYDRSRLNLIRLLPRLTELRVFDNSEDADPAAGMAPRLKLLLHVIQGRIVKPENLGETPEWAKPIVAAAIRRHPE